MYVNKEKQYKTKW